MSCLRATAAGLECPATPDVPRGWAWPAATPDAWTRQSPMATAMDRCFMFNSLQRFEKFDEIRFLPAREIQCELFVVVVDDVEQRRRAPVVEVRRVLPDSAQRRASVHAGGIPSSVTSVGPGFRRIMEER